jgi:hypothetical protein
MIASLCEIAGLPAPPPPPRASGPLDAAIAFNPTNSYDQADALRLLLEAEGRSAALAVDAAGSPSGSLGRPFKTLIVFLNAGVMANPDVAVAIRRAKATGGKLLLVYERDARHGAVQRRMSFLKTGCPTCSSTHFQPPFKTFSPSVARRERRLQFRGRLRPGAGGPPGRLS